MFNETRIGTATVVEFIRPDGMVEPMNVDLQFRSDDPHAVTLRFHTSDQESTWLVGRELLSEGLTSPAGIGDVRLRPDHGDVLVLELFTEDSHAVFHLSAGELGRFLDSTYAVVPAGREVLDFDLLLRSAAGPMVIWGTTSYSTLAAFRAASGREGRGIQADPRFTNPSIGFFTLAAGSPAIDSANSSAPGQTTTDALAHVRVNDPATPNTGIGVRAFDDRGAYEYQPAG